VDLFTASKKKEIPTLKMNKENMSIKRRRGLYGSSQELLNFKIIDNILNYSYKYERITYYRSIINKTHKEMFKITFKIIDAELDFVFNDLKAKYFNGLKIISTQNTRLFRIFSTVQNARPLNRLALFTKKCPGFLPKVKDFFNFTGSWNNYHVIQFFVDKVKNVLNSSDIFQYLNDVKKDIILLIKGTRKKVVMMKNSFLSYNRYSKNAIVLISGLSFLIKKRRLKFSRKKTDIQENKPLIFTKIKRKKRTWKKSSFNFPIIKNLLNIIDFNYIACNKHIAYLRKAKPLFKMKTEKPFKGLVKLNKENQNAKKFNNRLKTIISFDEL
jgi:hypothetical protein